MPSLFTTLLAGRSRKTSPAWPSRPRSRRPMIELLEDRTVPSTFKVTNLTDASPSTTGSLRWAVAQANAAPGSTIDFAAGLTGTIRLQSALNIATGMEIDGPGASVITLSGRNLNQVFTIQIANPVTITNLTIANGNGGSRDGGAIVNYSPLTLSRVTFANNQAPGGGALVNTGTATISDCRFINNRAVAPDANSYGGAIYSEAGTLTVTNSQFRYNHALGASNVTGSTAGLAAGGAVYCYFESLTDVFRGCTFTGNYVRGGTNDSGVGGSNLLGLALGGAIYGYSSSLYFADQCMFTQNYAQGGQGFGTVGGSTGSIGIGQGGAIDVTNNCILSVNASTFSYNHALGANKGAAVIGFVMNEGDGGAINCDSNTDLTVSGSMFTHNMAVGGISGFRTDTLINGYYGSNAQGGAIDLGLNTSGDIDGGTTFSYNVAQGHAGTGDAAGGNGFGGAIFTFPNSVTSLTIRDTSFLNNRAQGGNGGSSGANGGIAQGGGLFAEDPTLNLSNLTFTSNRAIGGAGVGSGFTGGGGYGGAMALFATNTTADTLNVRSNLAKGGAGLSGASGGSAFGGGLYTVGNSLVMISNSTVTLNTAQKGFGGASQGGYGGGIVDLNGNGALQLINTSVFSNLASTSGGDLYP